MAEVKHPIYFIDEAVISVPDRNHIVCVWNSDNEVIAEDCDACIGYDVYDSKKLELIDGGECDYNTEEQGETIIDKLPMIIDFIYDKQKEYEILSRSIDTFKESKNIEE